jgi:hypothetical protein
MMSAPHRRDRSRYGQRRPARVRTACCRVGRFGSRAGLNAGAGNRRREVLRGGHGELRHVATDVTSAVIPNSGHWLMEEQPAATIAAIVSFLGRK